MFCKKFCNLGFQLYENGARGPAGSLVLAAGVLVPAPAWAQHGPGMMAHGYCYLWQPGLVSLHVGSDAAIGMAYLVISACLAYLLYHGREHLPFSWMVAAFGAFIVACGITHLIGVWTVWAPHYWISGWAKLATALVSIATALALPRLIPRGLQLLQADRLREEALQRQDAAVRLALFGGAMAGWAANGADRRWTEALTSLLGCGEAELERNLDAFLARVHADDRDRVEEAITSARESLGGYEIEFRVARPDGSERWLEARGRFWRPEAQSPLRLSGFFWDVTRRKRDEERLRIAERTLQATANGIVVCDAEQPDHPIILANESFTEITGWLEEEVRGRNCRFLNEGARDQTSLDDLRDAIREGRDCRVTLRNRRRNGEWFWNDLTVSPVLDDGETRITHWVGVQRDVSHQMSLAEERETMLARTMEGKAEAEQANRAKDDFLAVLSHELRTPLQASTTWLQLAEKEVEVSPQMARILAALRRSTSVLARLVEDLLDSSRILAGRFSMKKEPVNVCETVKSTVHALEALAEEKGIRLRLGEQDSEAVVDGDAQRLSQAVRALIDNAIKYSPDGGEVVVDCRVRAETVEVSVADEGEGFEPGDVPHLFDRFAQADTSRSRRHGGLGLGLFLVRSIVEMHGGTADARSGGPGKGARFVLHFPVLRDAEVAPAVKKVARPDGSLRGLEILLVEDDDLAAEALAELLSDYGAAVAVAGSARRARELLEGTHFDLLVSDVGLPDEDGVSLVASLRRSEESLGRARVPAVAMSGYTGPGEVAEMLAAGFDAHVSKPIEDFAAFQAQLVSLLRERDES